jgi:protein-S-isoprenylcysteine O-methyltransferase Ste14
MHLLFLGIINFASTPTEKLVTKGVYSISRNSSYVSYVFVKMSIRIACLSWPFLLIAIADFVLLRTIISAEEHFLLENYESYYKIF